MSKYTGPRLRIIRRLGRSDGLFNSFTTKTPKNNNRPGQHGRKQIKPTPFSNRLREKQKLRVYYGISEKQIVRYVKRARKDKRPTSIVLLRDLEARLDAVLYRSNWAPTIPAARQVINHGHIFVNGKRVTLPSFSCHSTPCILSRKRLITYNHSSAPGWSKSDSDIEVNTEVSMHYNSRASPISFLNESLVLEFYSNRLSSSLICIFMSRTSLPSIFVPLVGLVLPRIAARAFFTYIELQSIESVVFFSIYL